MSPASAQTFIIVNDAAQGPTVNNPTGQGDLTKLHVGRRHFDRQLAGFLWGPRGWMLAQWHRSAVHDFAPERHLYADQRSQLLVWPKRAAAHRHADRDPRRLQPDQTASVSISNSILADTVGGSDLTIDQPSNVAAGSGGGRNVATSSVTFQGVNIVPNATYPGTPTVNGPAPVLASPQVGTLQLNAPGLTPTMAITTASPAFHGTACDPSVTTDQRGVARPQPSANACDIGAYELQLQTITFPALPTSVPYGTAPIPLTATASSQLPVSYSITGTGATLSGNTLTIVSAPGSFTITAMQSGNGEFAAATPVSEVVAVVSAAQTITFQSIAQQVVGASVPLTASASSNLPITFQSLTSTVCSVNGATAKALSVGTCTIQASQAGDGDYTANSTTQSYAVVAPPNFTITPTPSSETVCRGHIAAFLLTLQSVNGFNGKVTLSCSGGPSGSYCVDLPSTVPLNGKAYALSGIFFPNSAKPGTYTITFTGVSGSLTNTASAKFTVK